MNLWFTDIYVRVLLAYTYYIYSFFFFFFFNLYKITMLYNQKAHTHGFTN